MFCTIYMIYFFNKFFNVMKINYNNASNIFYALLLLLLALPIVTNGLFSSALADATSNFNDNAFSRVMCNVLKIATGSGGKAFAAFAIISVGIGFFTGKVSWGLMIGVAAGIAAIFGAPSIVAAISGQDAVDCSSVQTNIIENV